MNKTSARRLLHTILPFMIMNMVQRSVILLSNALSRPAREADIFSLIAFIAGVIAAIFTFSRKIYDDTGTDIPPLGKASAGLCILQTVSVCALMVIAMQILTLLSGGDSSPQHQFTVIGIISALIIHPIAEEYVFRKMFYGELRLMNPVFGCIAQTLMFAILHSTVDGMIYALFSGILLCILSENTGRLITCIAAHIFINLRSLLCLTVLASSPSLIHLLDFILVIAGILCFIGGRLVSEGFFSKKEDGDDA